MRALARSRRARSHRDAWTAIEPGGHTGTRSFGCSSCWLRIRSWPVRSLAVRLGARQEEFAGPKEFAEAELTPEAQTVAAAV